ncbi:hypothetical protein JL193_08270 [Polaribacter batillariae]|uniref:Uncharacterized protein n=1 Tax=Polaribacter batillariae TaxID=2808900 RepID=A0ABX7SY88_9FLAO|nr:hypothetical protein [Polaribacter batillariae]QTD39217.1 hypothetical protein JL193_08270 [Polaribacter batillariae]
MTFKKQIVAVLGIVLSISTVISAQNQIAPSRTEVILPIHKNEFRNDKCKQRVQGGNPKTVNGYMQFNGSMDGNRQVDPQIAIGGGYILHGSNSGLVIYDKNGNYIDGVSQKCFNNGIDPKMYYDAHNKMFVFDLWNPWDKSKKKPVNIAVSETDNPNKAWNIYPVPTPKGVDGGGIGYSKKWIAYSFPGGDEKTFVLKSKEVKSGKPATIYHFKGSLGHPVFTQDDTEDLYFFEIKGNSFVINKVTSTEDGSPVYEEVGNQPHHLKYINYPPKSPQKGTNQKTSSGDRNPKNLVMQGGYIWFSQAVNVEGNSGVQWHQIKTDGSIVQTGLIHKKGTNYIQTTIGVNANNDVLVGFQETNSEVFISPRMAFRYANDPKGTLRKIVNLGKGRGATNGTSWGDYSGTTVDGDNFKDLWTIQSIANEKGRGETVIVKVPMK